METWIWKLGYEATATEYTCTCTCSSAVLARRRLPSAEAAEDSWYHIVISEVSTLAAYVWDQVTTT